MDVESNNSVNTNANSLGVRVLPISVSLPNSNNTFVQQQLQQNGDMAANPLYGDPEAAANKPNGNRAFETFPRESSSSTSMSDSSAPVSFSFRGLTRRRKLLLISLCMGELCSNVMLSIMAPFFPSKALAKGVSSTVSGWIFGVLPLAQVIFSPIVGTMIKSVGVKFLFLSGAFMGGSATILFGALDQIPSQDGGLMFIAYCFAVRITTAWGFASYTTAAFVIIAQEFGDNVSQVFGIAETFCGVGAVLGPAIGGLLYGLGGFGLPFFALGSAYLLTVPLSWTLLPSGAEILDSKVSSLTLLRVPGILMMCWTVIVLAVMWTIFEPVLGPHLAAYKLTPLIIGLVFLLTAASYALSAPVFGWLSERISDLNILVLLSLAGCTACLAMLGPSPLFVSPDQSGGGSLALVIVSLALFGIFSSMGVVPSYEYMLVAAE